MDDKVLLDNSKLLKDEMNFNTSVSEQLMICRKVLANSMCRSYLVTAQQALSFASVCFSKFNYQTSKQVATPSHQV